MLALAAACSRGNGAVAASGSPATPVSSSPYPDYNTQAIAADATGMTDNAVQTAQKIRIGLNIGNTMEAVGGKGETAWYQPKITREFVQFAKTSGFNAIRLPVSWDQYANQTTAKIDPAWLARVKEVVQYCIAADLYVIVNIHWDGGWLEENVTPEKQLANNYKQQAYWHQIATQLRDFDGRLLFASANEPNVKTPEQMAVLMSYHQTFIDAVRATGGRNAYRTLIVQGPSTDVELTYKLMTAWPKDTVAERLMAEIHYYTPWNFTGMTKDEAWGKQFFYWGAPNHSSADMAHNPTLGEEATVDAMFGLMKTRFVDKGIPVVVGEFGAIDRAATLTGNALTLHEASRAYYAKVVTQRALAMGLVPFYWDTGALLDRSHNLVRDQQTLDALMAGAR
jgi:aryl-phospho-beta-D-glucosidase BglC (GH1 family)